MGNFKQLRVWEESLKLSVEIYKISRCGEFSKDRGLRTQIQRAAVSVPSNIAEGDERGSNRASVHYFNISKGSMAEVITQLHIAHRVGYISEDQLTDLENKAERIRGSLRNLIKARGGNKPINVIAWFLLSWILPVT